MSSVWVSPNDGERGELRSQHLTNYSLLTSIYYEGKQMVMSAFFTK